MAEPKILSEHCSKRLKQRNGLSKKHACATARQALKKGLTYEQVDNKLLKNYLQNRTRVDAVAVMWDNTCYICNSKIDYCITAWQMPYSLQKKQYDGKCILRKPRKYQKMKDVG